ncbi:ribonuclease H [Alphaproteobacteria bacterium endosymbiont of Tiliacea citrago]|uniref:ribonuclease H family protein n=1 Tax=Alphaproteobacteria bacterium endosymbiont of Tiliacea citrago TaxID=3077944 RepID=UPI00313B6031
MQNIRVFCDGACSGNPGRGAWGYIVIDQLGRQLFSGSGFERFTTNNKMELTAVIEALTLLNDIEVVLDSKYVMDGITSWIHGWKKNNWKTKSGLVKNLDLWKKLDSLVLEKKIKWQWQKGHNNSLHDYVDKLARESILA